MILEYARTRRLTALALQSILIGDLSERGLNNPGHRKRSEKQASYASLSAPALSLSPSLKRLPPRHDHPRLRNANVTTVDWVVQLLPISAFMVPATPPRHA